MLLTITIWGYLDYNFLNSHLNIECLTFKTKDQKNNTHWKEDFYLNNTVEDYGVSVDIWMLLNRVITDKTIFCPLFCSRDSLKKSKIFLSLTSPLPQLFSQDKISGSSVNCSWSVTPSISEVQMLSDLDSWKANIRVMQTFGICLPKKGVGMEAPRWDQGSQISLRTTDVGKGTASMDYAFWEGPRVPKDTLGLSPSTPVVRVFSHLTWCSIGSDRTHFSLTPVFQTTLPICQKILFFFG